MERTLPAGPHSEAELLLNALRELSSSCLACVGTLSSPRAAPLGSALCPQLLGQGVADGPGVPHCPGQGGAGGWLSPGAAPNPAPGAELRVPHPPAELDPGYRPMYSGDIPLDPIDMHMDMDGDYPMDAYSDGVRAPFADHMLA